MATDPRAPISASTIASLAAERIREGIADGTFPLGSQLKEAEVASVFGVSRGPVREAVVRLVGEGLLRAEPRRGVHVMTLSEHDLGDIYLAREALEVAAGRVLIDRDAIPVFEELARHLNGMKAAEAAGRWREVAGLDRCFHAALVDGAASPWLSRMYSSLAFVTEIVYRLTSAGPGREDIIPEHVEILGFLRAGNRMAFESALHRHLDESRQSLTRRLSLWSETSATAGAAGTASLTLDQPAAD